jgi:hypothetical protein
MTTHSWRRVSAQLAVALAVTITPFTAWGWSDATHVYMAKHTDKAAGQVTANEMCNRLYGSVAVDMFAYDFSIEGQTLHALLHDRTMTLPVLPWDFATTDAERALAYGLASHNNTWGTDATAHIDGITAGNRNGYVIAKAQLLASIPQFRDAVLPLVGASEETLLLVSHILVEFSIDLVVADREPAIAGDMVAAAFACPEPAGVQFLVDAWGPPVQPFLSPGVPEARIRYAFQAYRFWLAGYGTALQQPNAQKVVAGEVAKVASEFLRVPPEYIPYLAVVIDGALGAGKALVAADLQEELDATIGRVNAELSTRKITP